MIQLGQYPAPSHVLAHVSDTHFLAENRALYGVVDTEANLTAALTQLEASGSGPDALILTGDLADLGEPEAYRRLRAIIDPAAARMGTQVVWVMGNHDERERFQHELFDEEGTNSPQDRVHNVDGLRIISLDTTVPGYHHGELTQGQLDWLAAELSEPAPHGTILAMHHPPIPSPVEVMAIIELQHQDRLAHVVRNSDVRAIIAGHLHYSTHGTFAGIPVSVAGATCYTLDAGAPPTRLAGVDGGQSFTIARVYDDQIVHSVVPVGEFPQVAGFSGVFLEKLAAMTPEARLEAFSNKLSTVTAADIEAM